MADNANLTAGDGTIVAGADEIDGVKYPRVKANWGPDGTINDTDVASGKPFPVQLRGSDGTDVSNTLPVSIASVPSHAVTNAGTFAVQAAQSGTWTVQPGNTANTTAWKVDGSAVTQPISVAASAGTIGKAEDVASADADVGVPAMAVRKLTPANTSGSDGDYEMLQMSQGQLWTNNSKWQTGATAGFMAAPFSVMTTELNALTAGGCVVSSAISSGVFNQTTTLNCRYTEMWITLNGNFAATPGAGANFVGWFLRSTDGGTTFEDTNANTAVPRAPDFIIPLVAAAYTAGDVVFAQGPILLPATSFKIWLQNNAGTSATTFTSGNIITMGLIA